MALSIGTGPPCLAGVATAWAGAAHLERIHHWLTQTAVLGFVPVPLCNSAGQTLQEHGDRLWELAPWMAGAPETARPPALARMEHAFEGLAAFHARLAGEQTDDASPGLRLRHQTVANLVHGGFDRLQAAVTRQSGPADPLGVQALSWLALAREVAPRWLSPLDLWANRVIRLQPCLRDARPEHFLFEGDRLSGLVDFGAMGVETVAADLARLIGEWLEGDAQARASALAAYQRVRPLDAVETSAVELFEAADRALDRRALGALALPRTPAV